MKEYEGAHPGNLFYTLFKLRSESPELKSEGLAARLAQVTGQKVTAPAVRQTLRRARFLFAQYLVEEVARSLPTSSSEELEHELIDLGFQAYCRRALDRRRKNLSNKRA